MFLLYCRVVYIEIKGPSLCNGRYTWTQSLREIIVEVPLPAGTTAKMLDVQILPGRLDARLKGAEGTLVDGEWEDAIFADECMWYLEDGYLVLTIAKQGEMTWWKRIIKGDAAIDIKKIEPETSNLDDLAPDLRQTVEKMMHDQRQKAAGLPTTAEKDTQEKLKSFMAMHPEMDFSKVAGMAG
ncbi:nuclear movement family protein [Baffinella frigidus]|nr:nuclear movement family protein [Cryptophyta sp. CCMP2293]